MIPGHFQNTFTNIISFAHGAGILFWFTERKV